MDAILKAESVKELAKQPQDEIIKRLGVSRKAEMRAEKAAAAAKAEAKAAQAELKALKAAIADSTPEPAAATEVGGSWLSGMAKELQEAAIGALESAETIAQANKKAGKTELLSAEEAGAARTAMLVAIHSAGTKATKAFIKKGATKDNLTLRMLHKDVCKSTSMLARGNKSAVARAVAAAEDVPVLGSVVAGVILVGSGTGLVILIKDVIYQHLFGG